MVWISRLVRAKHSLGFVSAAVGVALNVVAAAQPAAPGVVAVTPAEMKWASQGGLAAPGMEQLNLLGDPAKPSTVVENTIIEPQFNGIDVIGDSPIVRRNQVLHPHPFALHVVDYQPPGGQNVRARPFLEGNNFRADALQVASENTQVASESAQGPATARQQ